MASRRIPGTTVYLEPELKSRIETVVSRDHGSTVSYWINKFARMGIEQHERTQSGKIREHGRGKTYQPA